ncbi:MAG: neutral zinc metallopeptidase, partial [Proteiniphilum sp.]|nr:neutral zinc metallopeptidase [Proteiniphilum sp.]
MKWINRNDSEANFEDRRGRGRGRKNAAVGGVGAIVIVVIALLLGQNPFQAVDMVNSVVPGQSTEVTDSSRVNENEELKVFTLGVFNSANDVWSEIFRTQLQQSYVKPTLVTFTDETVS